MSVRISRGRRTEASTTSDVVTDRTTSHVVTGRFGVGFDEPVSLADLRAVVDAALPLWAEAAVSVCIDGIWHTPEAIRIATDAPADPLAPIDADQDEKPEEYAEDRADYVDAHEVR